MANDPIITSLLEADFYKFTTQHLAWKLHRHVPVRFGFNNRTTRVRLAEEVPVEQVREELAHLQTLRLRDEELSYLGAMTLQPMNDRPLFDPVYIDYLRALQLPEIGIDVHEGQYVIEAAASWPDVTLVETLVLNVMTELYGRALMKRDGIVGDKEREDYFWKGGYVRLADKAARIRAMPDAMIIEFGNRRRFSRVWQESALNCLIDLIPTQLRGTSNVRLAKQYSLTPMGTFPHEAFMVYSGIYRGSEEELLGSHNLLLRDWWNEYGTALSVALSDTYGSDFFFRSFKEYAARWVGIRHDSGDPIAFGENAIAFYEALGIDPKTKTLVFSDGLTIDIIERLYAQFNGRIRLSFGWGTNLTNDLGYPTLSLVMKAITANSLELVKLSDNLAKAIGSDEVKALFIRVFGYHGATFVECAN